MKTILPRFLVSTGPAFIVAVLVMLVSPGNSYAVPGDVSVKDTLEGRYLSLNEVKGNFRLYNARADENPNAVEDLERFLRKKFEIGALPPDDITYDLLSNTLQVTLDFPFKVKRRRGADYGSSSLLIFAPLERPLGRKMLADREQVYVKAVFHLNSHGAMVIDALKIFFGGEEVYGE